jgi:hypothetical protein
MTQLVQAFQKLHAPDPEGMARSEIEENLPQLASLVFLRAAWKLVADDTGDWIESYRKPAADPGAARCGLATFRIGRERQSQASHEWTS